MGDSGNAEATVSHLHFEIYSGDTAVNPYTYLKNAKKINNPKTYPALAGELLPYGETTNLSINIAEGSFSSSTADEYITGPGMGGGPHIRVFKEDGTRSASFFAYDKEFRGGVNVAAIDINSDGIDEIVTGAGRGGGPHVRIFNINGQLLNEFFAYDKKNRSGVRVSACDTNGDGLKEVITTPEVNGGPEVRIFDLEGKLLNSFFAYDKANRDGVDVTCSDVDQDGSDEIITGPGPGSGAQVRIFKANGTVISSFFAYDTDNRSGLRVTSGHITGSSNNDIVVVPASVGGPHLKVFSSSGQQLRSSQFLEEWWRSGYDVSAENGVVRISAGDAMRRSTIRKGL